MVSKAVVITVAALCAAGGLTLAARASAAPGASPTIAETPGVHATDASGKPVGPFNAGEQAARDAQPRAPKPTNPAAPSTSCPTQLGPDGAIEIVPGLFKPIDGTMTSAVRVTGSDGRVYEIYAGGGRPAEAGTSRSPDLDGRFVVIEYTSRTIDVCRDTLAGTTSRTVRSVDINPASGIATITGVTSAGSITFSTAKGRTGTFQPSTRTVS